MRKLLVLALLFLVGAPLMTPALDDDAYAKISRWLDDNGYANLLAHSVEAFDGAAPEEIKTYRIGGPIKSYSMTRNAVEHPDPIGDLGRWSAPIYAGEEGVGMISGIYRGGVITADMVIGDNRIADSIADLEVGDMIVYDPELSEKLDVPVLFVVDETAIAPANNGARNVVLGSVPMQDFLSQRQRILLDDGAKIDAPEGTVTEQSAKPGRAPVRLLLIALGLLALLTGTITWLRWEQKPDVFDDEAPTAVPVPKKTHRSGTEPPKKKRFSDPSDTVSVYHRGGVGKDSGKDSGKEKSTKESE